MYILIDIDNIANVYTTEWRNALAMNYVRTSTQKPKELSLFIYFSTEVSTTILSSGDYALALM